MTLDTAILEELRAIRELLERQSVGLAAEKGKQAAKLLTDPAALKEHNRLVLKRRKSCQ